MRYSLAAAIALAILTIGSSLVLASQDSSATIEAHLLWWVPSVVSIGSAVTIFLQIGRWMQRREGEYEELVKRLDRCHVAGSDYSHRNVHEIHTKIDRVMLRVGAEFVRKEQAESESRAIRELMTTHNHAICDRLERIEKLVDSGPTQ